jgi:uncharacterized membrane protein YhaH (DUF805 family)
MPKELVLVTPVIKEPVLRAIGVWKDCVTNRYVQFGGRATRSEFWQFAAVESAASFVLAITVIGPVVFAIATLLPSLAAASRRLHDAGKSALLLAIPAALWLAGALAFALAAGTGAFGPAAFASLCMGLGSAAGVVLAYLMAQPSSESAKYGAAPSPLPGRCEFELKDAFVSGIRHYFDFNGRMQRHEFWFFLAGASLLLDLIAAFAAIPVLGELFELLGTLCWLFFIIPVISAVVRRLRDIGINPLFALFLPVLVLAAIAAGFAALALTAAFGILGFVMGFLLVIAIWVVGLGWFAAVLAMPKDSEHGNAEASR